MSETTFILTADEASAVRGFFKLAENLKKTEDGVKKNNAAHAKTKSLMDSVGQAALNNAGSIAAYVGGFASLGTIIKSLHAIGAEMDDIAAKRNEFGQVALTAQQAVLKIAHLRGDVSQASQKIVMDQIKNITMKTGLNYQAAASTLFFSESQLGANSPAAMSSAMNIAKFAAPAGLTAEEVKLIPKLFGAIGATDELSQNKALNQLYKASGGSIAETGEFLQPFIKSLVTDVVRGFTYEQSISRMTAAIGATGSVEEAATMATTAVDIAAGRTEQALEYFKSKYLFEQAERIGLDTQDYIQWAGEGGKRKKFKKGTPIEEMLGSEGIGLLSAAVKNRGGSLYSDLTDPERHDWFTKFYQQHQSPEQLDEFKTKVGSKGFNAVRAIMSPVSQQKFAEMFPIISGAGDEDLVGKMSKQFMETIMAAAEQMSVRNVASGSAVGQEARAFNELGEMTRQIRSQTKARADSGEDIAKGIWGKTAFGKRAKDHAIFQQIMAENLALSYEQGGDQQKITDLIRQVNGTSNFTINPQLLKDVYETTGGFGRIEESGRLAYPETISEINRTLNAGRYTSIAAPGTATSVPANDNYFGGRTSNAFMESMQSYFQINQQAADKNLKASENNLEAAKLNQQAAKMTAEQNKQENTVTRMRGVD